MSTVPSVAINATFTLDNPTGLGVYTYELTKELLRVNNNIDLTVYTSSADLNNLYPNKIELVSQLTSPSRGFKGHLLRMLWQQSVLPLRLRKRKPDLFYSTVPEGMLFPHMKQIVTLHDILPIKSPESNPKMKYHFRYTLPVLLRNSQAIISVSENTKEDVINYYKIIDKPVYVIYEGYDRTKYYPRAAGIINKKYGITEDYLLYIGDMRPYKNLERTLEAFKQLDLQNVAFVIGGRKDPRFYPNIQEQVNKLRLGDRVICPGYIPDEDIPFLYSGAIAFIFPSLYEGFGLPPLEAMACGCPVIVSRAASLPEVCGDAAYYVDPLSINSLAEGMQTVLTNNALRQTLREKGLERAKLFSWEKSAQEHIKVFHEVLHA
jgi:glycosyltransferase involved in cell wall biosynthesis